MTNETNDNKSDATGFACSPKSGQFRKGQSGNPAGRPRKQKAEPAPHPEARHPTRELLRAEAKRTIAINDASGRHELSVREASIRALTLKALKGGTMAQRTLLQYFLAEDERYHQERKENFEFWRDYQKNARVLIEAARHAGQSTPMLLPHPDDLEFDWSECWVRFLGVIDEEQLGYQTIGEQLQALAYEMAIYTAEENSLPNQDGEDGRLGVYMGLHVYARAGLPPRLRRSPESYEPHILAMAALGQDAWGEDLKRRCQAIGVPFVASRCKAVGLSKSFAEMGFKWSKKQLWRMNAGRI